MRQWAINFIYCVMTIILLGYITPEGKYEKQIKLAISVLFVAAIIIPVARLLNADTFNDALFETTLSIDRFSVEQKETEMDNLYQKQLADAYKADLERALSNRLSTKAKFKGNVVVKIDDDFSSQTFGEILSIEVAPSDNGPSTQAIKKIINEFYSVEEENIYITESEGNG